ncbi:DUF4097 family beta strand repeat-containing protein [Aliikangiella coralliicola]|uniref:DUF4097 domain-containing protein n=1 Tax=Aliikangiella coralliicola TaxID=2592383 RepID=A0A545TW61_9GAMM|nr:DUF4097 family beta strand repeat-containing protein [Aliikangiella coralliicola]TQV81463.1 DUF4097 domain-containing protein [Aliikangiella coralliicola]
MKKLAPLFVPLFFFGFCSLAMAGDKVDKSLDVEAEGIVEVHNVRGDIKIRGWQQNQVKVSGTLDDLTEKFVFKSEGGHTFIKVKLPRNSGSRSREGSKLKIMIPVGSKLIFSGVATDVNVAEINGGVDINSVSGDIKVKNTQGRTYINSVSGELELDDIDGSLEVSTVSGDLDAKVSCKKLSISGVSADLVVKSEQIESASVSTVSGDTRIYGSLLEEGELKLSSVSGEAFYYVKGGLNARISMETAPGGDIVNEYSEDRPKSTFINSHNLRFTAGNGSGVIRMSTVSGNIGLKTN